MDGRTALVIVGVLLVVCVIQSEAQNPPTRCRVRSRPEYLRDSNHAEMTVSARQKAEDARVDGLVSGNQTDSERGVDKDETAAAVRVNLFCTRRTYTTTVFHATIINGQWRLCWGQVQRNYCHGFCYSYYYLNHFNYARHACYCCKPVKYTCDKFPLVLDCGNCDRITIQYERIHPASCSCRRC